MSSLFLVVFIAGLLLGVRLMFFGAERHRRPSPDSLPLRRWEPAAIGFLLAFGVASYLLTHRPGIAPLTGVVEASVIAVAFAAILTRVAIATARHQPEHDSDDPRYILQGQVGIVTVAIPAGGEGMIRYETVESAPTVRARDIDGGAISAGVEVCIERVENRIAYVELWSLVERRL